MAATALVEPLARAHVRPGVRVSESRTFSAAVTLIALHIIDDEFLQPAPGTSAQGHLRAGLPPLGGHLPRRGCTRGCEPASRCRSESAASWRE
jgi:hypothetical protein